MNLIIAQGILIGTALTYGMSQTDKKNRRPIHLINALFFSVVGNITGQCVHAALHQKLSSSLSQNWVHHSSWLGGVVAGGVSGCLALNFTGLGSTTIPMAIFLSGMTALILRVIDLIKTKGLSYIVSLLD